MKKLMVIGMVVGMLAVMAAPVNAQGRGGRGGPRGQRGPGGRFGADLASLLRMDEVNNELEITDEQKEQLRAMAQELRPKDGERRERPDFRNMSDEEQQEFRKKMTVELAERAKKVKAKLGDILLPPQIERLEQISVQMQGVGALRNAEFAKRLGVTDEQIKAIGDSMMAAGQGMREEMRELMQSGDMEAVREKMTKMRKEIEEKALSHLTEEQRTKFEEAKGEKFDMPRFDRRGGRGPRGRGGDRGERRERPRRPAAEESVD